MRHVHKTETNTGLKGARGAHGESAVVILLLQGCCWNSTATSMKIMNMTHVTTAITSTSTVAIAWPTTMSTMMTMMKKRLGLVCLGLVCGSGFGVRVLGLRLS